MAKYRYPDQPRDGSWYDNDYKAKCALAEKLGDVKLRQWCVERIGVGINGMSLDFDNVNTLFEYIKGRKTTGDV